MTLEIFDVVVAHQGSDASMQVDLRLSLGAIAGMAAVMVLSPLVLVSRNVRELVHHTIVDVLPQEPSDTSIANQAVLLVLGGLILGAIFELVVLILEQIRLFALIPGGSITLTDLIAVTIITTLVYRRINRVLQNTRDGPRVLDTGLTVALSAVYGIVALALICVLHTVVLLST